MLSNEFLSAFSLHALTRRRPLTSQQPQQQQEEQQSGLHRKLGLSDLIFYGVGCSVGAGIYSLVGVGANLAGPSIALSFLVCGIACIFTALCYADFAARIPLAGSAYTYAYISFGELCGWLVGWNLTLGYAVSAAVVARSWAVYSVNFLQQVASISVPSWWTKFPVLQVLLGIESMSSYTCCPLAMLIINLCTLVLITGVKESTRFNTAMTLLNLSILGFVLLSGIVSGSLLSDNLTPIFPHGVAGMARGSGLVFFSYLGFDMVACLSEEVKNPARNMPIGIVGSLMVSMTIYVSVAVVVVGIAPLAILGQDTPIVNALLANACCTHEQQIQVDGVASCLSYTTCYNQHLLNPLLFYGSRIVSFGAIFGLTTATFSCLMGQPRYVPLT
jgi:APA family basic amino acid/polyamine antiporter